MLEIKTEIINVFGNEVLALQILNQDNVGVRFNNGSSSFEASNGFRLDSWACPYANTNVLTECCVRGSTDIFDNNILMLYNISSTNIRIYLGNLAIAVREKNLADGYTTEKIDVSTIKINEEIILR